MPAQVKAGLGVLAQRVAHGLHRVRQVSQHLLRHQPLPAPGRQRRPHVPTRPLLCCTQQPSNSITKSVHA